MNNKLRNIFWHIIGFIVMVIWGSTFASTKTLINHGMNEVIIFFTRFIIAYIFLLAVSHKRIWADNKKDELLLFISGLTGGSVYFLAENYALHYTQTTDVSFIIAFTPLLTVLCAYIFNIDRQTITRSFVGGLFIALIGIALLIFKGQFNVVPSFFGDSLAMLAALLWAIYSILIKPLSKKYDVMFITRKVFFYGFVTTLPLLPFFPTCHNYALLVSSPLLIFNMLFLSIVASFICYLLWNKVLEELGALKSSYYLYVNPIAATIVSFLFMDEELNGSFFIGSALILLGILLSEKRTKK